MSGWPTYSRPFTYTPHYSNPELMEYALAFARQEYELSYMMMVYVRDWFSM